MDVESLKKEKAKRKASYTRILHKLSDSLDDEAELPSRRQIKQLREKLGVAQETLFNILLDLHNRYQERGNASPAAKV